MPDHEKRAARQSGPSSNVVRFPGRQRREDIQQRLTGQSGGLHPIPMADQLVAAAYGLNAAARNSADPVVKRAFRKLGHDYIVRAGDLRRAVRS